MTEEQKTEMRKVQVKIDDTECLSLLQKDFLKLVYWACENYGKYTYSFKKISERYEKIKDDFDIEKEIEFLLDNDIITMDTKKTIFNGEYITIKNIKLNKTVLDVLINKNV